MKGAVMTVTSGVVRTITSAEYTERLLGKGRMMHDIPGNGDADRILRLCCDRLWKRRLRFVMGHFMGDPNGHRIIGIVDERDEICMRTLRRHDDGRDEVEGVFYEGYMCSTFPCLDVDCAKMWLLKSAANHSLYTDCTIDVMAATADTVLAKGTRLVPYPEPGASVGAFMYRLDTMEGM